MFCSMFCSNPITMRYLLSVNNYLAALHDSKIMAKCADCSFNLFFLFILKIVFVTNLVYSIHYDPVFNLEVREKKKSENINSVKHKEIYTKEDYGDFEIIYLFSEF